MARPNRHVIVFARCPRLGQGKRRLASAIGDVEAMRFQKVMLSGLISELGRDRRWRLWLAATPDHAARPKGWPPCVRTVRRTMFAQGRGDLGERMARSMWRLPAGPVLLIGTDIPAITTDHVARAFHLLGGSHFVFGPATDGGFWLVGAKRLAGRPRDLFRRVRWSSGHALADSLASLPAAGRCALTAVMDDVDNLADWVKWKAGSDRALRMHQ